MKHQIEQSILIVDDKPENLASLEALLSDCGANIIRASSGRQALAILLKEDISLVLLDVQMPEMDGFEVAKLMRGQKRTAAIPIIFITAIITDEQHILEGYTSGAVDYIIKPIVPSILLNKINVFLELDLRKRQLEYALEDIEQQKHYFESILRAAGDGLIGMDLKGVITFANPAALKILGYQRDDLIERSIFDIWTEPLGEKRVYANTPFYASMVENKLIRIDEGLFYKKDGDAFPVALSCAPLAGGEPGAVVVFQDITVRKELEERLVEQAKTDSLTGLANRMLFVQTLRQAIARAERMDKPLAVLFLDLDQFKQINDTMGHDAGDVLLMNVAKRIMHAVRTQDVVARLGGDEFTVLLEDLSHEEDAARVADKILVSLRKPFVLNNSELIIGASIGIATYPQSGESSAELMQAADVAMYRVKSFGRNNYQFFTPEMNEDAQSRLQMEQELRQAITNNSMELYYQPQVSAKDHKLIGVEALIRWNRDNENVVSPNAFIDILEETGLILPYGKWILWMACLQARNWQRAGIIEPGVRICVNISARQFASPDFYETLKGVLEETELSPEFLEIEITESALLARTDTVTHLMNQIKSEGIRISVDDFGTGYSSLSYLKQYPIDTLKIDRSFIMDGLNDPTDELLIKAMVDMGHSLGFSVLMEGVENEEILNKLKSLSLDGYQGYYFAKPMTADDFVAYLQEKATN